MRKPLLAAVPGVSVLLAALAILPAPAAATRIVKDLTFTGAPQTWTVPPTANTALFTIYGGQGGGGNGAIGGGQGGTSALTRNVAPGQVYTFVLGGKGADNAFVDDVSAGGYNGGARGAGRSYGGGGRSDLLLAGDPLLIAGGGGAGGGCSLGFSTTGGDGGGTQGGAGVHSGCNRRGSDPGRGGTQTAGGAGGNYPDEGSGASTGTRGQGGTGSSYWGGGGGGGGYYGGGGANYDDGAGGGSGWGKPGTSFTLTSGGNIGDGKATISYTVPSKITLDATGSGGGYVKSTPAGIDCGDGAPGHPTCASTVPHNTRVTLTAVPNDNVDFIGFTGTGTAAGIGGICGGSSTCTFTANADFAIKAEFRLKSRVLTVTKTGAGAGYVTSEPAGIDCGGAGHTDCKNAYNHGTVVILTAHPGDNADFGGFSGLGCTGDFEACQVQMTADGTVSANFVQAQRTLRVTTAGTGTGGGYVTSDKGAIDCGRNIVGHGTCSDSYADGTVVQLTLRPDENSNSGGFEGCDAISDDRLTCTVTPDDVKTVTAYFIGKTRTLTVATAGTGVGRVTSNPARIDCGLNAPASTTCTYARSHGATTTLTAQPAANTDFVGFTGGGCSGASATCAASLNGDTTVTATFRIKRRDLRITTAGSGTGTVAGTPGTILCGRGVAAAAACADQYDDGTVVTLTANPTADTDFAGFTGGGCSGAGLTCEVVLTELREVTATFTVKQRTLTVTTTGAGSGKITSEPAGISCPDGCTTTLAQGTTLKLSAVADPGSVFLGFAGEGCAAAEPSCTVTAGAADLAVTARFAKPTATTVEATDITTTSATLNGTVDTQGTAVDYLFAWGQTAADLTQLPLHTAAGADVPTAVGERLDGLAPDTTYTFRIVSSAGGVTTEGTLLTFRTPALPPEPTTPAATTPAATTPQPPVNTAAAPASPAPGASQAPLSGAAPGVLSLTLSKQLVVRGRTASVGCKVLGASVKACKVTLKTAAGKVLGSGSGAATVKIRLTKAGLRRAGSKPGGLSVVAIASATTTSGKALAAKAQSKLVVQNRRILSVKNTFGGFGAQPSAAGKRYLQSLAKQLRAAGVSTVTCTGYAASVVGPKETRSSLALSKARAAAACAVLKAAGLNVRYVIVGAGKTRPVASNATDKGRALNRRVEIKITYLG